MSVGFGHSVVIDIWTVPSGREQEIIDALCAAFEQFRCMDGFIEGGVLANSDGTRIASYVKARSAADLQRGMEQEAIRERLRELERLGSSHRDAYERKWVAVPPGDRGSVEVSHGAF
jgi:heme-degrading monooxygenase HmoA